MYWNSYTVRYFQDSNSNYCCCCSCRASLLFRQNVCTTSFYEVAKNNWQNQTFVDLNLFRTSPGGENPIESRLPLRWIKSRVVAFGTCKCLTRFCSYVIWEASAQPYPRRLEGPFQTDIHENIWFMSRLLQTEICFRHKTTPATSRGFLSTENCKLSLITPPFSR